VRGLPFSFTEEQVYRFFEEYNPQRDSIKLGYKGGRKTGQAVVLFNDEASAERTL